MFAVVLILNPVSAKELILTYAIREGQLCLPGMLFSVKVRGRKEEALVLRLRRRRQEKFKIQDLGEAIFPYPVVQRQALALARWLARYYICPLNRAAALFLPPAVRPVQEIRYFLEPQSEAALFTDPAWQFLWAALAKAGSRGMTLQRISQRWNKQAAEQAERWFQAGYLRKEQSFRRSRQSPLKEALAATMAASLSMSLSPAQGQAFDRIRRDIEEGTRNQYLLFGVTGSGKTEVYLRLAAAAAAKGKQTIYLVPEISLVPQLAAKARQWFEGQVAILHSNLTASQRFAEWERIRQGEVKLIIGPRSALFAPVAGLGLIVIDEEHENTYKQSEPEPRYDARKTAETLARIWRVPLVRGSATPDLESLYRSEKGRIQLLTLPERVEGRAMPPIQWVNMNKEMKEGHPHPVSRPLLEALRNRKAKGEQAILLMNRRGFHTYVLCRDCGKSLECPRCSIPLTYHRAEGPPSQKGDNKLPGRLLCHYCDYQSPMWQSCSHCGSTMLQYMGTGTQRVVDYLAKEIPELRILRLDMDSTGRAGSHMEILKAFQEGRADVLVGTQMVAKGFDFPKVTLSAVLHIDGIINLPDYQSSERAFQLILQTAGRAGRGERPGEVMVQTFYPENPVFKLVQDHDYLSFYRNEIALRQALDYPPVKKIARILVTGLQEDKVKERLEEIMIRCRQSLPAESGVITWLGPAKAPLEKIKNRWRWHLILLAPTWAPLAHCLSSVRAITAAWPEEPRIILDMEPKSLL